jgi:hypothetical protein
MTTRLVQHEWRARIAAEYGSAAITQNLVLWLIQLGAPPDLIEAGLAIVTDELAHSALSHEVYAAAGGTQPPAIDRDTLGLTRRDTLELDVLRACVRVFCLGETVAVPLFSHLRAGCTQPVARTALDRILRDEVRHRDFGWDLLDWLTTLPIDAPARVTSWLPAMLGELRASYAGPDRWEVSDDERAWGLAPPGEYADILARTLDRDYKPRFAARGVSM